MPSPTLETSVIALCMQMGNKKMHFSPVLSFESIDGGIGRGAKQQEVEMLRAPEAAMWRPFEPRLPRREQREVTLPLWPPASALQSVLMDLGVGLEVGREEKQRMRSSLVRRVPGPGFNVLSLTTPWVTRMSLCELGQPLPSFKSPRTLKGHN